MNIFHYIVISVLILPALLIGESQGDLFRDLLTVKSINARLGERFPAYPNYLLGTGYFNMPSARMTEEGCIGIGYSHLPPYRNYNLKLQLFDCIEVYGNYRIFSGIEDPHLTCSGFGEKSDKGASIKIALAHPETFDYALPGLAFGLEDFLGTKGFESHYFAVTQVFPDWNLECTLGYGTKRIKKWFGGASWIPFYKLCTTGFLKNLAVTIEYDATHYKSERREPHPDGRAVKSRINCGIKTRFWNFFDFSASTNKGKDFAYSLSALYNLGMSKGFFPKIGNPPPLNYFKYEPICLDDAFSDHLIAVFDEQGFDLQKIEISCDCFNQPRLLLHLFNYSYRYEEEVRERLNGLLAKFIPDRMAEVIVTLVNVSLPVQEYRFSMDYIKRLRNEEICPYELFVLTPRKEAAKKKSFSELLYKEKCDLLNIEVYPKLITFLGSAKGKFKYLIGVNLGLNGFLLNDWYYSIVFGYTLKTTLHDVNDFDRLNPSQLINVRSDAVNYAKKCRFTVDEAFCQKWWNLGEGWFGSFSFGLFECAYGGIAGETLYYPVHSNSAFGIEGALLDKRRYSGIGLTNWIRKLDGHRPHYKKFQGSQLFANLYYNWDELNLDFHFKAGKFLANDWGLRTQMSHYYPSGFRVFFWTSLTNAKDRINGHRYHDYGVGFSIPLDILYTYSSRDRWSYSLSAWLRDSAAYADTGIPLYWQIRDNREHIKGY